MVRIVAPASLSNLGPGFDRLGVAISGWQDVVRALPLPDKRVTLSLVGSLSTKFPSDPDQNVATIAAKRVFDLAGFTKGVHLELEKGIPPGSGLGGSAASAVAGACAAAKISGCETNVGAILDASLFAENFVSGGTHADNVAPCLFGGLVDSALSSKELSVSYFVPSDSCLHFVVIKPDTVTLTRDMRAILGRYSTSVRTRNNVRAQLLLESIAEGRMEDAGKWLMTDEYAEPKRAEYVTDFNEWKKRSLENGALGFTLSGSGPAMMALSRSGADAERIRIKLQEFRDDCSIKSVYSLRYGALHSIEVARPCDDAMVYNLSI